MFLKTKNVLILLLLCLISICFIIMGCAAAPNPEEAVKNFWSAFKEGNYEKASTYIASDLDTVPDLWPDEGDELYSDEMAHAFIERIHIITEGHEIHNGSATVNVNVTWPDIESLFGNYFLEAMPIAFAAAFEGMSDEEMDDMLKTLFFEVMEDTPDVTVPHEVPLILEDGQWKLMEAPFPDLETDF